MKGNLIKPLRGLMSLGLLFSSAVFAASTATAAGGSESGMSGGLAQGLMLAAFAVIFYFLILRPQSKRAKEHRNLVTGIQKGDEVVTTGGMLGKISRVTDNFFIISIAEGV